jgi:hypothetical protein
MASIARIIYGTAWKKSATAELVSLAIRSGFRGIDTACQPKHYDEPAVFKIASTPTPTTIVRSVPSAPSATWCIRASGP